MAAHSNRWLLRGKWVAGQSVRCCFPVFGKELTVSFALALGRFFSSKGCQIEWFISVVLRSKNRLRKVQKLRVFGLARGWIAGRFFAHFEKSTWWRHLLPSHVLECIDCRKISVRRKGTVACEVDWSVSMTSQGIVSVEWQLCMLLTMMTVMPACCNICFFYFFLFFQYSF